MKHSTMKHSTMKHSTMKNTARWCIPVMLIITLAGLIGLILYGPIPQDPNYHRFADTRTLLGIPNFWNVISNVPFLFVGILGLYDLAIRKRLTIIQSNQLAYTLLFVGTLLVGLGSGYYHLAPDNTSLVWDRLPMTIAFMALFSIILSEFISESVGKRSCLPLIAVGILSVGYWHVTESQGHGDLRPYAIVQFLPMLIMPFILLSFPSALTHQRGYWLLFATYCAAKLFEHFDASIYQLTGFMSGHAIKHVFPALGLYAILIAYRQRPYSDRIPAASTTR